MAKDGLLPEIFGRVDKKGNLFWGTMISGMMLVMTAMTIQFSILWDFISLGILLAFNMTNTSLLLIRTKKMRPRLSVTLIFSFVCTSFAAAMLFQKGVIAHPIDAGDITSTSYHIRYWNMVLVWILFVLSFGLMLGIWLYCPQSHVQASGFKAPLVPLVPCLAISFNWFLFAQMHLFAILMLTTWIAIALGLYLLKGIFGTFSVLSPKEYEMVESQ